MQITPKLLTLVKIFDSLNHSFNFYWQNNDSKNIHSKKNLIIHSSKIFIQKKKIIHSKKNSFKKKAEHSFKKNIHSKVFLIIHSMKIFIFLKNAVSATPSCRGAFRTRAGERKHFEDCWGIAAQHSRGVFSRICSLGQTKCTQYMTNVSTMSYLKFQRGKHLVKKV